MKELVDPRDLASLPGISDGWNIIAIPEKTVANFEHIIYFQLRLCSELVNALFRENSFGSSNSWREASNGQGLKRGAVTSSYELIVFHSF